MFAEEIAYDVVHTDCSLRDSSERKAAWEAASSLQGADGLEVSAYAHGVAEKYVEGAMLPSDLSSTVESHYIEMESDGVGYDRSERQADIVATRMIEALERMRFHLRPTQLVSLHGFLFRGVDIEGVSGDWAGRLRTVNLEKREPVLGGRSVTYADFSSIASTLDYDFDRERSRVYGRTFDDASLRRFCGFISNIWQCHPFRVGNTRTVALFSQMYLRSLGIRVDNTPFKENGTLFRDSLVRANFSSIELGVDEEPRFIRGFYRSVITGRALGFAADELDLHGVRVDQTPYRQPGNALEEAIEAATDAAEAISGKDLPGAAPSIEVDL